LEATVLNMPRTRATAELDAYLDLVREFPLRRLKNEEQHSQALSVFTKLSLASQGAPDGGVLDYLDVLAGLIDQYEQQARLKLVLSHRTPAGAVQHLIQASGLTVSGLAKEIGLPQSNLSEMLSGRRDFSKAAIAKLCDRFLLSPQLFFHPR
jgi:antitoxin component HigA of HigAB toxin-antitoxin module